MHLLQTVFFEQMPSKRLKYLYETASPTRAFGENGVAGAILQLALLGAAVLLVVVGVSAVLA